MESDSVDEFVEWFYDDMLDWRHTMEWDKDRYYQGELHSTTVLELIPPVVALIYLCGTDPERTIIEAASFGRQADTIAGLAGNLVGALHGVGKLNDGWVETVETANRDFFDEVKDDQDAGFEVMAHRLVEALQNERRRAGQRHQQLDELLSSDEKR